MSTANGGAGSFHGRLRPEFPSQIIVDVTEKCNLSCPHCASPAFRRSDLYAGRMLDPVLNTKLCKEVAESGRGITQYLRYAASGEPLLHPHITEMLAEAVRSSGARVALTTNGTLLNASRIEALLTTGLQLVDVSIDAFEPQTYAQVRKGGSLTVTQANVIRLIQASSGLTNRPCIAVSYVEQPANSRETAAFEAFWRDQGADNIIVRRLHSNAGAIAPVAVMMWAANAGQERRPCLYPWERVVIGPRGWVGFCPADWTHRAAIADFRSTTIREVWQGHFLSRLRKAHCENDFSHPEFGLCGQCPDWAATRWPSEGRSYADLVAEIGAKDSMHA